MEQIKISAKNLGAVALPDFCPRCYWIKLKAQNKLPWQIFPGIFSSLDAFQKKAVHAMILQEPQPEWLQQIGDIGSWEKVLHWSKFKAEFKEYGITLNGVLDDLLLGQELERHIPDYKTAKFTKNQDKLKPMYDIQLNGYSLIDKALTGIDTAGLWLIYFEPVTDEETAKNNIIETGFNMPFSAHPLEVAINPDSVFEAMDMTRRIYDLPGPPDLKEGCKDCANMSGIMDLLKAA